MGLFDDLTGTGKQASGAAGVGSRIAENKRVKSPVKRSGGRSGDNVPNKRGKTKQGKISAFPAGDVVMGSGVSADMLPQSIEDVPRLLPAWVAVWCDNNAVDDVRKMSPLVFRAMCTYIGENIKQSKILKDTTIRPGAGIVAAGSACNAYDVQKVNKMWGLFQDFCGVCDKVPFSSSFAAFCGVSLSYVREYGEMLTSRGLDLRKKTHDAEMDALRQKSALDPVGRLAILNNEYWSGGFRSEDAPQVVVDSVPTTASFALLPERKME